MCEHSNLSPAAALREARRKKILENSADRLKLIEGINSSLQKTSTELFKESKLQFKAEETFVKKTPSSDFNSKFNDIIKNNKELQEISDYLLQYTDKIDEGKEEKEKEKKKEQQQQQEADVMTSTFDQRKGKMYFKIFMQKRLHYILLALTVNIMFFFNVGYFFYENVLCPFYTVKALELLSRRDEKDFQPVLCIFIAGLPKNMQRYTKITLSVLLALFSDLCLYLFTFIIGTKIINNLY